MSFLYGGLIGLTVSLLLSPGCKKGLSVLSVNRMRVNIELLPAGMSLQHPIFDEQDNQLLDGGVLLSGKVLEELKSGDRKWVMLHTIDGAMVIGMEEDSSASKEEPGEDSHGKPKRISRSIPSLSTVNARVESLTETASYSVKNQGPALKESVVNKGTSPYDKKQFEELKDRYSKATKVIDKLIDDVLAGKADDSQPLDAVAASHVRELTAEDPDLALFTASNLSLSPEMAERSIRLSLLSIAMAVDLGFDDSHVREVGLCAMVCDWGKYFLPERLQDESASILSRDLEVFQAHPLYTAELISSMDGVSREVRLAATQVFENADGSGYPKGLQESKIHPYASVLQVANIYLTLTSKTRGREPYTPYDVMVYLLHQIKAGRVSQPAVRALLNSVSLFPIGSIVELEDGTHAKVIRRNQAEYTSPVVQKVGTDHQLRFDQAENDVVDLAAAKLKVKSAIASIERNEQRIDKDLMDKVLWSASEEG